MMTRDNIIQFENCSSYEAVRLCKDCKHMRRDIPFFWELEFSRCASKQNPTLKIDLVSGEKKAEDNFCQTLRGHEDFCGGKGKWFEHKRG